MSNINCKPLDTSHHHSLLTMAFLSAVATIWLAFSPAQAAEPSAFDIAARSDRSDRGFKSSRVTMKMVLRNATGQESTRILEQVTLEIPDENIGDKNLINFKTPRDIRGTALLSHAQNTMSRPSHPSMMLSKSTYLKPFFENVVVLYWM